MPVSTRLALRNEESSETTKVNVLRGSNRCNLETLNRKAVVKHMRVQMTRLTPGVQVTHE